MTRSLLAPLLAAACLALPATARAADTLVAADPAAQQLSALDGTIVWISGTFGHQRLMQRAADGTISAVKGAPVSRSYRSIDLGRDQDGRLRLTYVRCNTGKPCQALWDDLDGRRATYRHLTLPGCVISTAVSQWRARVAYGLSCTGSMANRKRTGLYTRRLGASGAHPIVRLPRPKDAVGYGVRFITSVDLRGERVAAVVADIYAYSFSQTVAGTGMRAFLAAASEGDSDEHARGLAIQSAATHWTLTDAIHAGDPNTTLLFRQTGDCLRRETLASPAESEEFEAIDVAADGDALYLIRPGTGIVAHTFAPDPTPTC